MTAKQLKEIHNFKQEGDESLYQAWERCNDLLYKCPTHDINSHQKTMADHSQKWHDGMTSRNIGSSNSNDGLAALVNKLDNLGRDMKKLKESVHAIRVGCQICEGPHLDKDCPLNKEVKQVEEMELGLGELERFLMSDRLERLLIDKIAFVMLTLETSVDKYVPIKVNVHAWKVKTDSLPTF
ncbi:hypothetical protein Tco_0770472 [Tanacetum coccineum]|uniref:Retrotransposon gag protein n=1 Tax=Tanacetum coccineum TaxID=301880 RepID=A0ABQ4ZEA5_9ASTR